MRLLPQSRLRPAAAIAVVLPVLVVAACGGEGEVTAEAPSAEAIETAVSERHGAEPEQAACVRERLEADLDAAELQIVVDEGMPGLPQARWDDYLGATVVCLTLEPDER